MSQSLVGASKNSLKFILIAISTLAVSCSGNILTELSNKTDDESLLEGVKRSMADGDYTDAVLKCTQMSAGFQADADAVYSCASAYAGRAGLDTLDLVTDLAAAIASGSDSIIQYMMKQNNGSVAQDITDLTTAIQLIQGLGVASARTTEQNALITLISIHSLGVIANLYADTNDDGTVEILPYDTCNATYLDAAGATLSVNALWEINASAGSSGISNSSTLTSAITTACGALGAQNFCAQTDPSAFTASQIKGARSLMSENIADFGIGDCRNPGCVCP